MSHDPNVVAVHTHLMLQARARTKSAQNAARATIAAAKAAGVHWSDVQDALREYEMSSEARREKAERQAQVLQALGVPVQLEMFDAYVPRDNDDTAQAKRQGWFAAICGRPLDPPQDAGTAEGQAWMAGWHEFQVVLRGYFGADETAVDE